MTRFRSLTKGSTCICGILEEVSQPAGAHLHHVYNEIDNLLRYVRIDKKPGVNIGFVVPGISIDDLVRFRDEYVELSFYNATLNTKSIEEIRRIKRSKENRPSVITFRQFERIISAVVRLDALSRAGFAVSQPCRDVFVPHSLFRPQVEPFVKLLTSAGVRADSAFKCKEKGRDLPKCAELRAQAGV